MEGGQTLNLRTIPTFHSPPLYRSQACHRPLLLPHLPQPRPQKTLTNRSPYRNHYDTPYNNEASLLIANTHILSAFFLRARFKRCAFIYPPPLLAFFFFFPPRTALIVPYAQGYGSVVVSLYYLAKLDASKCAGITLPYNVAMHPDDPIERHFRLIPAQKAALKRLKLGTIRNLLYHFPSRYEAAGTSGEAARLIPGTKVTLIGSLSRLKPRKLWKSKRNVTEGWFEDSSGRVKVMWFNQPYIASYLPQTGTVKMSGTVGGSVERPYIANPEVEALPAGAMPQGIFMSPSSSET